jgi:hypothetical protein
MSEAFYKKYQADCSTQLQKNEARKMRSLVEQARGDIQRSGSRWPFELTQNAHDPGPRPGQDEINLSLRFNGRTVVYEHDGKPFSTRDLAALLSGGSNKDFDSQETTGRFGTGFLLTHVLSHQIKFEGVVAEASDLERFSISLDRTGDEDQIYANRQFCDAAIKSAEPSPSLDGQVTARFTYQVDTPDAARMGVGAFEDTLPYLYATCEHLGRVSLQCENADEQSFLPEAPRERTWGGLYVWERQVVIKQGESAPRLIRAVRVRRAPGSPSSVVIVLEHTAEGWAVVQIPSSFPRIFARFPLRGSDFLPVDVILDGRFDLAQERDAILMKDPDKGQIAEALALLPELARFALGEGWERGFTLARVGMPTIVFGDPLTDATRGWWKETLSTVARRLAEMPIVRATDGALCKTSAPPPQAHFVVPRFDSSQSKDELEFSAVWQSASNTKDALPPALKIAPTWMAIVQEWMTLGVSVERIALKEIAELARPPSSKLADLKTKNPPLEWLGDFLNLVGSIAVKHNCSQILSKLLPDQLGVLKSPAELSRDSGIEDQIKKIGDSIGLKIRDGLLSTELAKLAESPEYPCLANLLETQVSRSMTRRVVVESCIQELSKQLPEAKKIPAERQVFRDASVDLLHFLWKMEGAAAAETARKCPLISSDGTSVRWSPQRKVMAPVSQWHPDAREFRSIYKADCVLAEDYVLRIPSDPVLILALTAWEMVYPDPLCHETPKELRDDRLKAMAVSGDTTNAVVRNEGFSQIALLSTELIQRCQGDPALAKALLGMVVRYVARCDKAWEETRVVSAKRSNEEITVAIRPALWFADLKSRAWVPVQGEKGLAPVFAAPGNLDPHLDPIWLAANPPGIRFLSQCFGFKELDLQLLAKAQTPEDRRAMEDGLARIVQTLGSNAAEYSNLAVALELKKRRDEEKERNRKFGLAVQSAIKRYLEANNLQLDLIDHGYDYDVFLDELDSIEAGTHHFRLADFLLEVKATTTGEVRLTPAQARVASEEAPRFVLCVVDLRGIGPERMQADWSEADIEPRTTIVSEIGRRTQVPHALVEQAKQCDIGLRNDNALRYGVPVHVWDAGIPISVWVKQLAPPSPGLGSESGAP